MYEICKKSGVFDKLESINAKEIESQKRIYESSKLSVEKEGNGRHGNKPKNLVEKEPKSTRRERCWFFENGFCRKGGRCEFIHPANMCPAFWKTGECQRGGECPDRHPVQVCNKYLSERCFSGNNCVHQHPINPAEGNKASMKTQNSPKSQSSPPRYQEPTSYYNSNANPMNGGGSEGGLHQPHQEQQQYKQSSIWFSKTQRCE